MEQRMMFLLTGCVLVLLGNTVVLSRAGKQTATSLDDVITARDQARLTGLFSSVEPYDEIETAYYVVSGLEAIGFNEDNKQFLTNACAFAAAKKWTNLRDIFYATSVSAMLKDSCKLTLSEKSSKVIKDALQGEPTVETLYYAYTSMANTGMTIDNETAPAALIKALENEDTPLGYAQAFLAASFIPDADLSELSNQIEDLVAQADESPTTLYYEGGLNVTSTVIRGIFALADRVGSQSDITAVQATKFGNYLVSSRYSSSVSDVSMMLSAAKTLASNNAVVPSALVLDNYQPLSKTNKDLVVRLSNILSGDLGQFSVNLKTIQDPSGEKLKKNKPMSPGKDKVTFTYNLFDDVTTHGVHTVVLSTETKKTSPVVVLSDVELSVTVSFEVSVGTAQLSVVDKEQDVTTKTINLEYPNTSKDSIEADHHSKVMMTFVLLSQVNSKPVTVHQAFVRLTLGQQEIFYVATADSKKDYTFVLDVAEAGKESGMKSGTYTITLIIGDFALENPFSWDVGTVNLKFPSSPAADDDEKTADIYKPKPIIEHMFRLPEKRPPKVVSSTFTVLVLVPFGMLLILWFFLGANISNIGAGGIWTIFFHLGLGAMLGLYYLFWTQLNMFQTLKYLVAIGVFTFFTGNRMLRNIAKARLA